MLVLADVNVGKMLLQRKCFDMLFSNDSINGLRIEMKIVAITLIIYWEGYVLFLLPQIVHSGSNLKKGAPNLWIHIGKIELVW